jgi:hypothetical protein
MWMNDVFVSRCDEVDFTHCLKNYAKTPRNTGSISATVLRQPPSQVVFGFLAADVTSAVIGNIDNYRKAWGMGRKLSH